MGIADPAWIREVPDGLKLQADDDCFVIAGQWMVLVSIDDPRPPPALIRSVHELQTAVRRNSLLTQYVPGEDKIEIDIRPVCESKPAARPTDPFTFSKH